MRTKTYAQTPACNAIHPERRALRCDLDRDHNPVDVHSTEISGETITWGPGAIEKKPRRRNSTMPTNTSEHQALSEAFTDGIKAAEITNQLLAHGEATCVRCGQTIGVLADWIVSETRAKIGTPAFENAIADALAEAMSKSDKHHTAGRSRHGYRPRKYGNDFGRDMPLLIEAPICKQCHTGPDSEAHPGPQFTKPGAEA